MCPAFNMTLPCNENGIILDTKMASNVDDVLRAPVADVFIYSHGWGTISPTPCRIIMPKGGDRRSSGPASRCSGIVASLRS